MQIRRVQFPQKPVRRGFTLIELLVVISIIATLMALILPAIQQARAAARRTECQNNLKNIALAAHNFASSKKGSLPPLGVYGPDAANPSGTYSPRHSWVVKLLPYMDSRAIYDQWQQDQFWNSSANSLVNKAYLKVLACPDDETSVNVGGGLSYVANAGYLLDGLGATIVPLNWVEPGVDWNGNSLVSAAGAADADTNDSDAQRDSGVFWAEIGQDGYADAPGDTHARARQKNSIGIEGAYDGGRQTIMFTENTWAGGDGSWASPTWTNVGFVFMLPAAGTSYATPAPSTYVSAGKTTPKTLINAAASGPEASTGNTDARHAAAPNSGHTGGVNVAWVEGSVGFVSQDIDRTVYAKLLSPGGGKPAYTTWKQTPLSDNAF
ncbi:MAG: DUF1559 domain-containing protein [Planctomycetaceae bacterium]